VFSPPRHQGHQAQEKPQTTQIDADEFVRSDRSASSSVISCIQVAPSNAKAQRRKEAKPTQPPILPTDHADQRRWFDTDILCVARFRPSDGNAHRLTLSGETPWPSGNGHGTTGPGNRFESKLSCRFPDPVACALEERRSRHLSFPFSSDGMHASPTSYIGEERQNRRASGTSAGEKAGCDERSRLKQTAFSPATGDLLIACRSTVKRRHRLSRSATAPLRLCAFASLRYRVGGRIWVYLCDLWAVLGGRAGNSKFEIRNPKSGGLGG
jgi:hypothetical protein